MLCFVLKSSVLLNILCIEYRLRVLPYAILSKPLHQAHFLARRTNASHALTCALTPLSKSSTQPPHPQPPEKRKKKKNQSVTEYSFPSLRHYSAGNIKSVGRSGVSRCPPRHHLRRWRWCGDDGHFYSRGVWFHWLKCAVIKLRRYVQSKRKSW